MPPDTLLTLEIEDQEIPCLFSQLYINGQVLNHHAVVQRQEIPDLAQDAARDLFWWRKSRSKSTIDPDHEIDQHHVLAPLATKAAQLERSMVEGPPKVLDFI